MGGDTNGAVDIFVRGQATADIKSSSRDLRRAPGLRPSVGYASLRRSDMTNRPMNGIGG